jgi:hypothetical protein
LKKTDIPWGLTLFALAFLLLYPLTRDLFIGFTSAHTYLGGFIKFAILATLGELLAIRIVTGGWTMPKGVGYRMVVWGFLGMAIVLVFTIYSSGVGSAMERVLLPGQDSALAFAFLTSTIMNLTFGPVMMVFHRITDTYIDLRYRGNLQRIRLADVMETIDWRGFYSFVLCKTIPLFWIPAHTITFLVAPEYRVLLAAALSVALGLILAFSKKKGSKSGAS